MVGKLSSVFWLDRNIKDLDNDDLKAKVYDPQGEYVTYWLLELKRLPKDKRNFPGFAYLKPIVPMKYGNTCKHKQAKKDSYTQ